MRTHARSHRHRTEQPSPRPAPQVALAFVPLIDISFGSTFSRLVSENQICKLFGALFPDDDDCINFAVAPSTGFWLTVAALALGVLASLDGSPGHRALRKALFPEDTCPPPTGCCGGCGPRCSGCCERCRDGGLRQDRIFLRDAPAAPLLRP